MTDKVVFGGIAQVPTAPVITFGSRHGPSPIFQRGGLTAPASVTSNPFAANEMFGFPFIITALTNVAKGFWVNGSAAGGNFSTAIYNADFVKVVESASTGGSGASVPQSVAMAAKLGPGLYYCVLSHNSATNNRVFAWTLATTGLGYYKAMGVWKQASITVGSLPATATPAAYTNASFPLYGLITRTVFDV